MDEAAKERADLRNNLRSKVQEIYLLLAQANQLAKVYKSKMHR